MKAVIRRLASAGLLIAVVVPAGCSSGFQFAEVEGTVTKGGKPLGNVRVEFWPEAAGPKSTAITDDQGKYALKSEDGKTIGAMVGAHRVLVKDMEVYGNQFLGRKGEDKPLNGGKKPRLGPEYSDPARTAFKKSVTGGQRNVIDLDIP
jgi:hypothetical protein